MTAAELKAKWPLYPKILFEVIEDGKHIASTILRKKFEGKHYLIPLIAKEYSEDGVKHHIKHIAELYIKHGEVTHPNSIAGEKGFALEILDDNQND